MTHAHRRHQPHPLPHAPGPQAAPGGEGASLKLEVVVKADTQGTLEAVVAAVSRVAVPGVSVAVIERAVGDVSQADLVMALTGSRLVVGFAVDVKGRGEDFAKQHGVEVRLYDLVDRLVQDLAQIAGSLVPTQPQEKVLGLARVIALFKSTRKGSILGCEVLQGRIAKGMSFRVIAAPGPIYVGVVESLHIERDVVTQARPGQRTGLKISDFNRARVGDLVECFEPVPTKHRPWSPRGGVLRVKA